MFTYNLWRRSQDQYLFIYGSLFSPNSFLTFWFHFDGFWFFCCQNLNEFNHIAPCSPTLLFNIERFHWGNVQVFNGWLQLDMNVFTKLYQCTLHKLLVLSQPEAKIWFTVNFLIHYLIHIILYQMCEKGFSNLTRIH